MTDLAIELGNDLCTWLGIDPRDVVSVTVHAEVGQLATATVASVVRRPVNAPPTLTTYRLVAIE